jgi:hypothetical protein
MTEPSCLTPFKLPVVARVLPEDGREHKSVKEVAGDIVGKRCTASLGIAGGALAELTILILRLRQARVWRKPRPS